jgi:hypothetical protein
VPRGFVKSFWCCYFEAWCGACYRRHKFACNEIILCAWWCYKFEWDGDATSKSSTEERDDEVKMDRKIFLYALIVSIVLASILGVLFLDYEKV